MKRNLKVYFKGAKYFLKSIKNIKKKVKNPNDYTYAEKFSEMRILRSILVEDTGIKIKVEGKENVVDQPALYIANHGCMLDPYIVNYAVDLPMGAVIAGDKIYRKMPFFPKWFKMLGSVYINRENNREGIKAIKEAGENIKNGASILIFPEGEITKYITNDVVGKFKGGSLKIAFKAKCPIVPIAVIGSDKVYRARSLFGKFYGGDVTVKIFPPYTRHLEEKISSSDVALELETKIKKSFF